MKILVVYDSLYGNTRKIAEAVVKGFAPHVADLVHVNDISPDQLKNIDLVVVGSPTHGGRPSKQTQQFLLGIKPNIISGCSAAAFDTSIPREGQSAFMRFILKLFGYACKRIAKALTKKGAVVLAQESFFVTGKEGPLKEGELKRAEVWGTTLLYP